MNDTATKGLAPPAHVPRELWWDHDLDDYPERFDDPYQACDVLHEGPDIIWAMRGAYRSRPGWVLTRFEHLQEAHSDFSRFSPRENQDLTSFLGFEVRMVPFEADPPEHTIVRQLVQPWFLPAAVKEWQSIITGVCDELIDGFHEARGCEFVGEFATHLPSRIFLQVIDFPREQLPQFLEWEDGFMRGATLEIRKRATLAIYEYLKERLAERRRSPKDDILSAIANGEVDGRRLSDNDAIGYCMLLYIGGLDTVKSSMGWYMRHLATDPALQSRLRDAPQAIPSAVNELLRAYGVTTNSRKVVKDMEFHGVPMRRGDIVALPSFLASRDPRAYDNPHEVDIDRKVAHVSMGAGPHICLGIHLARMEMKTAIDRFLTRFRNIRIPEGADVTWTSRGVWGMKQLPLVWD